VIENLKEPKLRKQRGIFYIDYYQNGQRKKKSLQTKNPKIAEKKFQTFCYEYQHKLIPESGRMTLITFLEKKLHEYKILKSVDHFRRITRVFKYMLEIFGDEKFLDTFKSEDGRLFIRKRKEMGNLSKGRSHIVVSNKTINNDLQIFRNIINEAVDEGFIPTNPFVSLRNLTHISKERDAFTEDELKLIFSKAPLIYKRFYQFLLYTGCRKNEAVNLKWSDIDFQKNLLYIRKENTKTKKAKVLNISVELRDIFQSITKNDSEYVFTNRAGRKHQNISYIFSIFKQKLGIRNEVTLHSFRHTTATYLLRNGYDISMVSRILGHSDIYITMKNYSHLLVDDLKSMSEDYCKKMNALIETV